MLPLAVARRGPTVGSATVLAISQLRRTLPERPPSAPRPVVTRDSGYDPLALARAQLPADLLVRLAGHRVFSRAPPPRSGRGRPRKYGAPFRCKAAATWGPADQQAQLHDSD